MLTLLFLYTLCFHCPHPFPVFLAKYNGTIFLQVVYVSQQHRLHSALKTLLLCQRKRNLLIGSSQGHTSGYKHRSPAYLLFKFSLLGANQKRVGLKIELGKLA